MNYCKDIVARISENQTLQNTLCCHVGLAVFGQSLLDDLFHGKSVESTRVQKFSRNFEIAPAVSGMVFFAFGAAGVAWLPIAAGGGASAGAGITWLELAPESGGACWLPAAAGASGAAAGGSVCAGCWLSPVLSPAPQAGGACWLLAPA